MLKEQLQFYGTLSLANNGGFASVRSRPSRLGLRNSDQLLIRVRGDGRTYYFDLRVEGNRTAFSYRVSCATEKGKWQEFRVPIKMFRATSFGRVLRDSSPVDASRVVAVGFVIADKREGPFNLDVDWIKVISAESTDASLAGS